MPILKSAYSQALSLFVAPALGVPGNLSSFAEDANDLAKQLANLVAGHISVQRNIVAIVFLLTVVGPAFAHTGQGDAAGGFLSGFTHPIFGPDHVIAMVAVGLWGVFLGALAIWVLPIVFPLVMAFGGALGILGVSIPAVETGIALSAVILGLCVAFAVRPPLWIAAIIVGMFAIFHGHAHGQEMPEAADAVSFAAGFVIATGLLHICGIAIGALARWPAGKVVVRALGGAIAIAGTAYLGGFA